MACERCVYARGEHADWCPVQKEWGRIRDFMEAGGLSMILDRLRHESPQDIIHRKCRETVRCS